MIERLISLDIAVLTTRHFRDDWRPVTATPMRLDPAIQPGRSSLEPQRHSKDQLCVPAVLIDGDSYRMRAHRARVEGLRKGVTPTKRG